MQVPGLAENRPSVLKGDALYVEIVTEHEFEDRYEYKGYVHEVNLDKVFLGFSKR